MTPATSTKATAAAETIRAEIPRRGGGRFPAPGPPPPPGGMRSAALVIPSTEAYAHWLAEFAVDTGSDKTKLTTFALARLAAAVGFRPPPQR
jgi:hypothetical protein